MQYNEIVSMQDIRTNLAQIADKVEQGGRLLVVRNSRPAFMLVPLEQSPGESKSSRQTWESLERGLGTEPVFSEEDVVEIVKQYRHSKVSE